MLELPPLLLLKWAALAIEARALCGLNRAWRPTVTHRWLLAFLLGLVVGDAGAILLGGWRNPLTSDHVATIAIRLGYRATMLAFCVLVIRHSPAVALRQAWRTPQLWLGTAVITPFICHSIAELARGVGQHSYSLLVSEFLFYLLLLATFAVSIVVLANADDPAWLTTSAGVAGACIAALGKRWTHAFGLPSSPAFYEALWTVGVVLQAKGATALAKRANPLPRPDNRSIYRTVKTLLLAAMFALLTLLVALDAMSPRIIKIACLLAAAGVGMVLVLAYNFRALDRAFLAAVHGSLDVTRDGRADTGETSLSSEHQFALSLFVEEHLAFIRTTARRHMRLEVDCARMRAEYQLSRQVAHDMRSPLLALEVAVAQPDVAHLPHAIRQLIGGATQRIRGIAADLAIQRTHATPKKAATNGASAHHLGLAVARATAEKQLELKAGPGVEVRFGLAPNHHALFARCAPASLGRVLSNLLNNAVEASGPGATVEVEVSRLDGPAGSWAAIAIRDRGSGISRDLRRQLGRTAVSRGQSAGPGLGSVYAQPAVSSWGGGVTFQSRPGGGTEVQIHLAIAAPPDWFCRGLRLVAGGRLLVLSCEPSFQAFWARKGAHAGDLAGGWVVPVRSAPELAAFVAGGANRLPTPGLVLLADARTSVDAHCAVGLAERHHLAAQAVLVTDHFADPQLQGVCALVGATMLPTALAAGVSLELPTPPEKAATGPARASGAPDALVGARSLAEEPG